MAMLFLSLLLTVVNYVTASNTITTTTTITITTTRPGGNNTAASTVSIRTLHASTRQTLSKQPLQKVILPISKCNELTKIPVVCQLSNCETGSYRVHCDFDPKPSNYRGFLEKVKLVVPNSGIQVELNGEIALSQDMVAPMADNIVFLSIERRKEFNTDKLKVLMLPSLVRLQFYFCDNLIITKTGLAPFKTLKLLNIQYSSVKTLEKGALESLPALQTISWDPKSASEQKDRDHLKRFHCDKEYEWFRDFLRKKPSLLAPVAKGAIYEIGGHVSPPYEIRDLFYAVDCLRDDYTQQPFEEFQKSTIFSLNAMNGRVTKNVTRVTTTTPAPPPDVFPLACLICEAGCGCGARSGPDPVCTNNGIFYLHACSASIDACKNGPKNASRSFQLIPGPSKRGTTCKITPKKSEVELLSAAKGSDALAKKTTNKLDITRSIPDGVKQHAFSTLCLKPQDCASKKTDSDNVCGNNGKWYESDCEAMLAACTDKDLFYASRKFRIDYVGLDINSHGCHILP